MNSLIMPASTAITLALVFYTIGVFGERRAGTLKKSHLVLFWLGLICDTTGTAIMTTIARTSTTATSPLHAITGLLAIILMLFHALWATFVTVRGSEQSRQGFHKLSICVWLIWLIPYCAGLFIGIPRSILATPRCWHFPCAFRRSSASCCSPRSASTPAANSISLFPLRQGRGGFLWVSAPTYFVVRVAERMAPTAAPQRAGSSQPKPRLASGRASKGSHVPAKNASRRAVATLTTVVAPMAQGQVRGRRSQA